MSAVPDESDSLLTLPLTEQLLATHPNALQTPVTHVRPIDLVHAYCTGSSLALPRHIRTFVHAVRTQQLPREPLNSFHVRPLPFSQGMSPKKAHEVSRMASYILRLVRHLDQHALHIVDIGAGQGYLTRALKAYLPHAHILALDADNEQTLGAQRWENRVLLNANPSIDHKVIFISPESLLKALDDWVGPRPNPVPVLFVALHACGSLTPDILRAYIHATHNPNTNWRTAGLVAVGCCYNLMNPSVATRHLPIAAYHLAAQIPSQWLTSIDPPTFDPSVELSIRKVTWRALLGKALQRAVPDPNYRESANDAAIKSATVPARWSRRPEMTEETLSTLEPQLKFDAPESGTGLTEPLLRLGRLRDSAYVSWNTFLRAAEQRMGVLFHPDDFEAEGKGEKAEIRDGDNVNERGKGGSDDLRPGRDTTLENDLAAHHVLRCLLGPVIESAILRDRLTWVRRGLCNRVQSDLDHSTRRPIQTLQQAGATEPTEQGSDAYAERDCGDAQRAELVNLFDQATGSGRNVAIVVAPVRYFPSTSAEDGVES
ncbi:hypothetical protein JR316_0007156 [Psilocybe cubensis]|uniref:Uncharacterized protein n=1 Tax=Psilocybe cubensis TaxID=181762 RepID=A0ACB8GYA8_PSICU|nr:hypothetical protein JR316_0007156 [Psilocybe cubensis]KAH9480556.1 hypothetical protein JR316_0007156 [Psilocybe cubensis]